MSIPFYAESCDVHAAVRSVSSPDEGGHQWTARGRQSLFVFLDGELRSSVNIMEVCGLPENPDHGDMDTLWLPLRRHVALGATAGVSVLSGPQSSLFSAGLRGTFRTCFFFPLLLLLLFRQLFGVCGATG